MKSALIIKENGFKAKAYGAAISKLANAGIDLQVVEEKDGAVEKIIKKQGEHVDLVILAGSNRLVQEAVGAVVLLKKTPTIAVFPGGASHILQRALGLKTMDDMVDAVLKNKETELVLSEVSTKKNKSFFFFSYLRAGFPAEVKAPGVKHRIFALFGKSRRLTAVIDKAACQTKAVIVLNGRYEMGEVKINRGGDWTHKGFRILLLEKTKVSVLLAMLFDLFPKLSERHKGVQVKYESGIDITGPENGEGDGGFFEIDGVIRKGLPVTVRLTDEKIKVIG